MASPLTRIVLLGFGALNRRVAELLRLRASPVVIVGTISRGTIFGKVRSSAEHSVILNKEQLVAAAPDIVVEAASREAVGEWGESALEAARCLVVSSASAFTDDALFESLRHRAKLHGSRLILSPGALGGIDALSAASRLSLEKVRHRIIKPPSGWGRSSELQRSDRTSPEILFSGAAREAAKCYPRNANATVVSALAGLGLDATEVELVCDPSAATNRHEILAVGDFGTLTIALENRPLVANPKSSELAALALVRIVENATQGIVI
jgi:aspartate dehydrogenase